MPVKYILCLMLGVFIISGLSAEAKSVEILNEPAILEPVYIDTATDERVYIDQVAAGLKDCDVIAFGELHDSPTAHRAELDLLMKLHNIHGKKLVLSLEMFERDTQPLIDEYLKGKISEEVFLSESRPWGNYNEAYRPLVEYAKANGLHVIAGNIPRRMANFIAKGGLMSDQEPSDKAYLPRTHMAPAGRYRDKFIEVMTANSHAAGRIMPPEMLELFYRAQCLKDDTMAESIADWRAEHDKSVIYHVQGGFHGAERLGVVEKLANLNPSLKIAVIDTIRLENLVDVPAVSSDYRQNGDYLCFVGQDSTSE